MTRANSDPMKQGTISSNQKLLVCCPIKLARNTCSVILRRTMRIATQDGVCIGTVAAVVLDCLSQKATHLLLGSVPPTGVYRLIPLPLIDRIEGETIWLQLVNMDIAQFPRFRPG